MSEANTDDDWLTAANEILNTTALRAQCCVTKVLLIHCWATNFLNACCRGENHIVSP